MYLIWQEKQLTNLNLKIINDLYNQGFLFTRKQKNNLIQTRSVRLDLKKFKLNSENKRILRKTADFNLKVVSIPYSDYHWSIGKLGFDFYSKKFALKNFSALQIKKLITDKNFSNFNKLLIYSNNIDKIGYVIGLETDKIFHYSYPFYNLEPVKYNFNKNTGLGMMIRAIIYAQNKQLKYFYLGSAQRPNDRYKLQFNSLEWFDGQNWQSNIKQLKKILKNI